MREEGKVPYAVECKKDKKLLLFLLENIHLLTFHCTALSHPPCGFMGSKRERSHELPPAAQVSVTFRLTGNE